MDATQTEQRKATVLRQIAALDRMTRDQLREQWRTLLGSEAPPHTVGFLRKRLAVRLQELFFGGLKQPARERMNKVLEDNGYDEMAARPRQFKRAKDMPVPGTRLIREYEGERYEVTVTRTAFEFQGCEYKSLSAIAKAITGTHWNGCAFFGLRSKGKRQE